MKSSRTRAALAALTIFVLTGASAVEAQRGRPGGRGGGVQRPIARPGGGGAGVQNLQIRNRANSSINNRTNFNRNTDINRNVNVNRNVQVNNISGACYGGCYHGWDYDHPVARAAAVTAAVAVTAAAIGSMVRTLPPSCVNVVMGGITYYQCGSSWYQPQYVGSTVQYVVVTAPR